MKNTKVRITTILAVLLSFLWFFGFSWTIQNSIFGHAEGLEDNQTNPETEQKQTETTDLTVLALGDSLTRGTGDETGKGYIGLVTDQLKEELDPRKVTVYNLGINGQDSSQLLQQLGQNNVTQASKRSKCHPYDHWRK